jgi:hypothetical protein
LQRINPFRNPSLNSSSDGSSGKSFAPTTPTVRLSHPAASYLLIASFQQKDNNKLSMLEERQERI